MESPTGKKAVAVEDVGSEVCIDHVKIKLTGSTIALCGEDAAKLLSYWKWMLDVLKINLQWKELLVRQGVSTHATDARCDFSISGSRSPMRNAEHLLTMSLPAGHGSCSCVLQDMFIFESHTSVVFKA